MAILRVAYAYVEPDGDTPDCRVRSIPRDIERFLEEHMRDLLGRAERGTSAPASFRNVQAEQRFVGIRDGSDVEFLDTAQELTKRLHTAMDKRAKRGFFVVLRRQPGNGSVQAGALKLDVRDEPAAAARERDGDLTLEAVRDLLDLPGDLQKGAVYEDPRPESEVAVGDRVMLETAKYFLRAIEAQQVAHEKSSTKDFLRAVEVEAPEQLSTVAVELNRETTPVSPAAFLQKHPTLVGSNERQQILARLETQPRPVRIINPVARPPTGTIVADDITIRGPAILIDGVSWQRIGSKWRIEIEVAEEPRRRYE
jgi:hypothetical protein